MRLLKDFLELIFPRLCAVCGNPLVGQEHEICSHCLMELAEAHGARSEANFVEKRFWGRIPVEAAASLYIFKKGNKVQTLLHQIKYRGNKKLAIVMGRQMGLMLAGNKLFDDIDILLPVPLHKKKERKRGYNQSLLLCKGIAETFPHPIANRAVERIKKTKSQTHMNRDERLKNMQGVFSLKDSSALEGKHILIVDDVITTGATTEACCQAIKNIPGIKISIASLAVSGDN